jgi:hypothetical protein
MKTDQPITVDPGTGVRSWETKHGDSYVVTGIDRNHRRFVRHCRSWFEAENIVLWTGSKWLLREGKRYLLARHR